MEYRNEFIQPEEINVSEIFKGVEYIVPIYQRNYAWETCEIEQLLDDINDSRYKYYLGSLIVNQQSTSIFEVIDGQQRLTTLFLLLSFLNFESVGKNSLRFEARDKSNRTLIGINNIKNTEDELEIESWFSEEIINGYSIIRRYFLRNLEHSSNFQTDFEKKLENIFVIRTQVPKKIDLNHYFEIMNTRGEQLELHEIVKGRILDKLEKCDKKIAASIWDACAQMDKYIQMSFSTSIRKVFFGDNWDTFTLGNFEDIVNAVQISDKKHVSDKKEAVSHTLVDILKSQNVKNDNENKDENEDNERFESCISFPFFLLQVNKIIHKDSEDDNSLDDKHFISLMERNYENENEAKEFIFSLLKYRYLFDKYIIKREFAKDYKDDGRWSLQRLEKYEDNSQGGKPIYKGTYNNDDNDNVSTKRLRLLQSCLRITYTSPKTMHWISSVLSCFDLLNDPNEILFVLEKYCCEKIKLADYRNKTGFAIERIVFTYLDYILSRDNPDDYQFQYRTSIEHFYPQNPITKVYWKAEDLHCLGNLALISISANSRFSNMLPHQKAEDFGEYFTQSPKLDLMRKMMEENKGKWEEGIAKIHDQKMKSKLDCELMRFNIDI
ncbi:MAG: DUF262 domain-containing HNH endonuclease family protein [Clostridia bacterium]|nr:DUF262 domain-containing HNH endonuclease family protein [Clostridia bacterium]